MIVANELVGGSTCAVFDQAINDGLTLEQAQQKVDEHVYGVGFNRRKWELAHQATNRKIIFWLLRSTRERPRPMPPARLPQSARASGLSHASKFLASRNAARLRRFFC